MTFILPSFGASAISAVPGGGGGGVSGWNNNSHALEFDGTDDYIDLGNSSDLAPSNITLSLWFKASGSVSSYNYLFIREGGLYGSYCLRYTNNNKFSWFLGVTGNTHLDGESSSTFTLTDWHHVALTYDQTNIKLYVDGIEEYSAAETRAIDYSPNTGGYGSDNTTIARGPFSAPAEGLIDEVAIFNSALSASDVTAIYNSGVPADLTSYSPVGWWRMGDNDGGTGTTITDQGSGGNDGTLTNGPTFSRIVPPYANQFSVNFDGTNDYMDCGGASTFSFNDGSGNDSAFSISAWVKMDNTDRARLVSKDTSTSSREYLFGTNNINKFNMLIGTGSVNLDIQNNTSLNTSNWFHVVATYDGSKSASGLKVYVNADASSLTDNSAGTYAGMSLTGGSLEIGRFANGHSFFNGLVDEVAIFNSELSASDVTLIYNNGQPFDISSLNPLSFWRMGDNDGGTGTTITDQGSGGNDGTLTNGPTFSTTVPS